MKCPNCEMEVPAGIPFCPFCSAEIDCMQQTFYSEPQITEPASNNDFTYSQPSPVQRGIPKPLFEEPRPVRQEEPVVKKERPLYQQPVEHYATPQKESIPKHDSTSEYKENVSSHEEKQIYHEVTGKSPEYARQEESVQEEKNVSTASSATESNTPKFKDAKRKVEEREKNEALKESKKASFEKVKKEDNENPVPEGNKEEASKKSKKKRSKKGNKEVLDKSYDVPDGEIVDDDPYNINEDRYYDNVEPVSLDELKQSPKIVMAKVLIGLAGAAAVILTLIYYVG